MKVANRFHYGWVIVIGAFLGHMGWATSRYLYPYVLPTMEAELNLSHVSMGSITSAYFIAYTIMTFVWGILADRIGPRKCMLIGQAIILIGLSSMGFMSSLTVGYLSYFLCGVGAAGQIIPIVRLLSDWFGGARRGTAIGIVFGGGNIMIVVLGFVVPMVLLSSSWRWTWWLCAALILIVIVICWFLLVDTPTKKGLAPIGANKEESSWSQHVNGDPKQIEPKVTVKDILKRGTVWNFAGVYITYGIGYVIFMTFAVAYLEEVGWGFKSAAGVFATYGALSIPGPMICGIVADRLTKKYLLAMLAALQAIGMLIFLGGSTVGIYVGAAAAGFAAPSIPTVMAASMADHYEPAVIGTTFGFITLVFGVGSMIGPTLGGAIGDTTGTLMTAILLAVGVSILSFVLALVLKKPPKRQPGRQTLR
jgi:sugar phosphate permease